MTKILSINYDLRAPGRNYETLYAAIKKLGSKWAHPLESLWIVVSTYSVAQVWDHLAQHIDQNDQLLVSDFGPGWASWNLTEEVHDWLNSNSI